MNSDLVRISKSSGKIIRWEEKVRVMKRREAERESIVRRIAAICKTKTGKENRTNSKRNELWADLERALNKGGNCQKRLKDLKDEREKGAGD